jgi:hypothetical protein
VDKKAIFQKVHFSSSYAIRPISEILNFYYSARLHQHDNFFRSSKLEVGNVLARLKDIEDRNIGIRFEASVPIEYGSRSLCYLRKRALDDADFYLLSSHDYSIRYQYLVGQLYHNILESHKSPFDFQNLIKLTTCEDLLQKGLGENKYCGGKSNFGAILNGMGFFESVKNFNLPSWEPLHFDSPPVQIDPTKSQQLMSRLSSLYRLPKRSNSVQFVALSLLSRRVCSFDEQIGQIVDLYEREITSFINGLSPIAR